MPESWELCLCHEAGVGKRIVFLGQSHKRHPVHDSLISNQPDASRSRESVCVFLFLYTHKVKPSVLPASTGWKLVTFWWLCRDQMLHCSSHIQFSSSCIWLSLLTVKWCKQSPNCTRRHPEAPWDNGKQLPYMRAWCTARGEDPHIRSIGPKLLASGSYASHAWQMFLSVFSGQQEGIKSYFIYYRLVFVG